MECDDTENHEGLKDECERRLATRETAIEETNAGDDEPDEVGRDENEEVMDLVADILFLNIGGQNVTAARVAFVELGALEEEKSVLIFE